MRRLVFILLLTAGTGALMAQEAVDYRSQYASLYKSYTEKPNDIATLVALADHFADTANPQHDLAQAGRYIHRAERLFEQYLQDDKHYRTVLRLIRKDITLITLRDRCRAVDSAAYAYIRRHARDMDEGTLAAFAEAFAGSKTISNRVNRLWVEKAYTRVCAENTIDAYYTFAQQHPGTPQADSAEARLETLAPDFFAQYDNEGDILLAVQRYSASNAMQNAAMLQRSRIAYAEACRLNTVGAYSDFIERFPSGINYMQALLHIDELNAAEYSALVTPRDFVDYALQHSDHPLADSAIARLRQMAVEDHSTPAILAYLENFPLDPAYSDIYKEYYRWHAAEGNEAPLRRFADENPQYPYRITLESDLARARGIDTIDLLPRFAEKDYDAMSTNIYKLTGRRVAFVALQRILQQLLLRRDWAGARTRWQHFGICFEDVSTAEYNALGDLLSAPKAPDPDIALTPGEYESPCPSPDGRLLYLIFPGNGSQPLAYLRAAEGRRERWEYGGNVTLQGLKGRLTHCALAADGRQAFLTVDGDIWSARVVDDTLWIVEKRLPYPVNTEDVETDAFPLPDGSGLLLVSDRDGGHNRQPSHAYFHGDTALATDIWFIPRTATGWGEPVNLGIHVNSPYCERSPLISHNMRTLYFISDGPAGFGYGDIFSVTRDNTDDWLHWGPPVNLGKQVNTPLAELSIAFAEGERRLYFCSASPEPGKNQCSGIATRHDTTGNFQSVTLDLRAVGADVQHVDIIDLTRQAVVQSLNGQALTDTLTLLLDRNHRYAVLAQAAGVFIPATDIATPHPRSIAPKGYSPQQVLGETFPLKATLYSDHPRPYRVLAVSDYELQQLALFLLGNPSLYAQIEVHLQGTDRQDCYDASLELATAVRTRLAELGVDTRRVRLAGYGNTMFIGGKHPATIGVRFLDRL